jgi:hypothetical protein
MSIKGTVLWMDTILTRTLSIMASSAISLGTYLRDASGNIAPFDLPGVDQTLAATINDNGVIVGEVTKAPAFAGFRRDASGAFSTMPVPVQNHGGFATRVTNLGRITGAYVDLSGRTHGFVE